VSLIFELILNQTHARMIDLRHYLGTSLYKFYFKQAADWMDNGTGDFSSARSYLLKCN